MKHQILRYVGTAVLLTVMPLIPAAMMPAEGEAEVSEAEVSTIEEGNVENSEETQAEEAVYRILQVESGEIVEVSVREYLIGAVAAEMPVSFETEALRAQAVAAHTYAERQCLLSAGRPELMGADFSDDPQKYQAYLTPAQQAERWGEALEPKRARLAEAVDAVLGELLLYEDTPIIAAFHAVSAGMTESAENVWGSKVPYLTSVESAADCNAPEFSHITAFSTEDVENRLTAAHAGLALTGEPSGWFGDPVCSPAGTVLEQRAGDGIFTGQELRSVFGLRSAAFTIDYANGTFAFTTAGSGHGVGMSQYGANAMAQEGASYREILAYYYPGAELTTPAP